MTRYLLIAALLSVNFAFGQVKTEPSKRSALNLDFEDTNPDGSASGWTNVNPSSGYRTNTDSLVKHGGKRSFLFEKADTAKTAAYDLSIKNIPAIYEGKELEVRAWIKFTSVSKFINLIVRVDDIDNDVLQFASLQKDQIKGTEDWKQYSLKIPYDKEARTIRLWTMLSGNGKMWVDDMELLLDGKPITDAPLKKDWDPNLKPSIPYGSNPSASGKVEVNQAVIYYETYGKGEPLLLLHGNSQSIKVFKKQIKVLSEKYQVIAVDTRAQGKSIDESTAPLSYDLFAEDMKTLLDSLHISKTDILGWSDGGNTALIMAYKYPTYVNKLAVMGAVTEPTEAAVGKPILDAIAKQIEQYKTLTDSRSKTSVRLFTLLLQEPHISLKNLHQIKAPVLVMAGEKDMVLDAHTRYIAKEIKNSKLLIFKGASHYAPVEIPEEFNTDVLRFLGMKNTEIKDMVDFTPQKF